MARYKYRDVSFHEPASGNLLVVDHKRTGKNAVVEGIVLRTRTIINNEAVKIETELTREEALAYIRDIAERIGGPGLAGRLPREL